MSDHDIQAAIDAGTGLGHPEPLEEDVKSYSILVPANATVQVVRAPAADDRYDATPDRPRGTYQPATVEALAALIDRHRVEDSTTIWVHPDNGRIVAIFNDNSLATADVPGWSDHRAVLNLLKTEEWKHWESHNNQMLTQVQFAEHIEEGLAEIIDPTGADMLEIAQTLQVNEQAAFRSASRLQDGTVQLRYEQTQDAKAGQTGQLNIPAQFTLQIAPFLGEPTYRLTARFRYWMRSGDLTLGYKLDRPDAVIRDALGQVAARLEEKYTAVFVGTPAS